VKNLVINFNLKSFKGRKRARGKRRNFEDPQGVRGGRRVGGGGKRRRKLQELLQEEKNEKKRRIIISALVSFRNSNDTNNLSSFEQFMTLNY